MLKHLPDALVCLCRALKVLLGANLLADVFGLEGVSVVVAEWWEKY